LCVYIAIYISRLDIVKYIFFQNSESINQRFDVNKNTILYNTVKENYTDIIIYLMQKNFCVEQCIIDIFDFTLLQCVIKKNLDTVNILYVVLCSKNKNAISVYDLLCDLIISINYRSIDQLFDIAVKILIDCYLD